MDKGRCIFVTQCTPKTSAILLFLLPGGKMWRDLIKKNIYLSLYVCNKRTFDGLQFTSQKCFLKPIKEISKGWVIYTFKLRCKYRIQWFGW